MELMNKPLIEYQEINIGYNEHLTYTQQYTLYKKWYIGYNSYWDMKHPFKYHSLFLDIDNVTQWELNLIVNNLKKIFLKEFSPYLNHIGFILQSSNNHYHIIIPHRFEFSHIISIFLQLYEETQKESIYNYMVNCVNRYFCTFRLSQKNNNIITGYKAFIIFSGKSDGYHPVNYYHWELMKAFFDNNPYVLKLMKKQEKSLMVDKTPNRNFMTYYGDKTNEPNGV